MQNIKDFDADGYELEFEAGTTPEDREYFIKCFPNVDDVLGERLHCTSCQVHFGAAPAKESSIKMHPVLKTTQCRKCYAFYNSGAFDKGEDGSELYCRWCGQGGEVYCCASCPYVFCKKCITGNLSRSVITDITRNDNWECFRCIPKPVLNLRARHWALVNYLDKRKKQILDKHKNADDEICTLMNEDRSKCCRSRSQKRQSITASSTKKRKRVVETSDESENDDDEEEEELTNKTSKKSRTKSGSPVASSKPQEQPQSSAGEPSVAPDIVCTPDILSMFEQTASASSTDTTAQKRPRQTAPKQILSRPNPPPLARIQPTSVTTEREVINSQTPKGAPVYHTINGYCIDLNKASSQESYKLPNGRTIQVKKANPNAVNGQSNATRVHVRPVQNKGPATQVSSAAPGFTSSIRYNLQGRTIANPTTSVPLVQAQQPRTQSFQPTNPQHIQLQNLHLQQQQQLLNSLQMVPQSTIVQSHHIPVARPVMQQRVPVQQNRPIMMQPYASAAMTAAATQANHLQTIPPQAAGQMAANAQAAAMPRTKFPNNMVGKERAKFEQDIFSTHELCQQITGKLNMMMKSTAYKNANSFDDVKELRIHLGYLYKYIIGRYETLHENCQGDIKRMEPLVTKAKDKRTKYINDGDDITIVEAKKICIELDSDDDDEPPAATVRAEPAVAVSPAPAAAVSPAPAVVAQPNSTDQSNTVNAETLAAAESISVEPTVEVEDENEIPEPPLLDPPAAKKDASPSNIDAIHDSKLKGHPIVVISRLESISRTGNAKIAQLLSRQKEAAGKAVESDAGAAELVELIEVEEDGDLVEVDEEENVAADKSLDSNVDTCKDVDNIEKAVSEDADVELSIQKSVIEIDSDCEMTETTSDDTTTPAGDAIIEKEPESVEKTTNLKEPDTIDLDNSGGIQEELTSSGHSNNVGEKCTEMETEEATNNEITEAIDETIETENVNETCLDTNPNEVETIDIDDTIDSDSEETDGQAKQQPNGDESATVLIESDNELDSFADVSKEASNNESSPAIVEKEDIGSSGAKDGQAKQQSNGDESATVLIESDNELDSFAEVSKEATKNESSSAIVEKEDIGSSGAKDAEIDILNQLLDEVTEASTIDSTLGENQSISSNDTTPIVTTDNLNETDGDTENKSAEVSNASSVLAEIQNEIDGDTNSDIFKSPEEATATTAENETAVEAVSSSDENDFCDAIESLASMETPQDDQIEASDVSSQKVGEELENISSPDTFDDLNTNGFSNH